MIKGQENRGREKPSTGKVRKDMLDHLVLTFINLNSSVQEKYTYKQQPKQNAAINGTKTKTKHNTKLLKKRKHRGAEKHSLEFKLKIQLQKY